MITIRLAPAGLRTAEALLGRLAAIKVALSQPEILLRSIDQFLIAHIKGIMAKGAGWDPLSQATMTVRGRVRDASRLSPSARRAIRSTYYARNSPKVGGAFSSPTAFGWTKISEDEVATAPGRIVGKSTLVRDFLARGTDRRKLLELWHFGSEVRVTDKMRRYLHTIGIHLSPTTTVLRRPPRPIYRDAEVERIIGERTALWLEAILGDEGGGFVVFEITP